MMGAAGIVSGLMLALDYKVRREAVAVPFVMISTVLGFSDGQCRDEAPGVLQSARRAHQARMSVL